MKSLALLLGLGSGLLLSCQKDPEAGLPAATQVGANTAGCLVNGQAFIAADIGGSLLSSPIPGVSGGFYADTTYQLSLNGIIKGQRISISLGINSWQTGTYALGKYARNSPGAASYSEPGTNYKVYITDDQHTGTVTLTYADKQKHIAAGVFEFTAVDRLNPANTVTITNGRFDAR